MDEASRSERHSPPSAWCDWWPDPPIQVTEEIYYGWPEGEERPWIWHWCAKRGHWTGAGTGRHDLVSREPLHLEPSLIWPCCGLHGWIRSGLWTPA